MKPPIDISGLCAVKLPDHGRWSCRPLLSANPPRSPCQEIYFVWSESEELMLEFAQSVPYFAHLPREEALRHRALRWNPLWWLSILGCAACILLGHGFHTACCQGGQVRSDERLSLRSGRLMRKLNLGRKILRLGFWQFLCLSSKRFASLHLPHHLPALDAECFSVI